MSASLNLTAEQLRTIDAVLNAMSDITKTYGATLLALAEGYGLTEEQRAALDRPEKERPKSTPGAGLFPNEVLEAYSKALTEMVMNARPVEPRLMVKLVGPAPVPMPEWLREDLGLPAPAPEPTPAEKAIEILGPELKNLPGYTPTNEEQP